MAEHPIQGLMNTAMESIKQMVDVNTIVGDAVQATDGTVIIPISRVSFGFAAGGGEYKAIREKVDGDYPFAGGSGAGISISPVAFMVVGQGQVKLIPVNINSSMEKLLDLIPKFLEKDENEKVVKKTEKEIQEVKEQPKTS